MELCRSGGACHNPNPDSQYKPTRLTLEGSESRNTGICSYCRRAGVTSGDFLLPDGMASRGRPVAEIELLDPTTVPSAGSRAQAVEKEGDLSDYDNFDPDDFEKKVENLVPDPVDRAEADAAARRGQSAESVATEAASSDIKEMTEPPPPKRRRGRPPNKKPSVDRAATLAATTDAAALDSTPPSNLRRLLKDPDVLPPTPVQRASASAESRPNGDGDIPKQATAVRSASTFIAPAAERLRQVAHPVFAPPELAAYDPDAPSPQSKPSRPSIGARASMGAGELWRGIVDVAGASGKMTIGYVGVFVRLATMALALPLALVSRPRTFLAIAKSAFSGLGKSAHMAISPLIDGRGVPTAGILTTLGGILSYGSIGYGASTGLLAGGLMTVAAWPIYRSIRGVVTGAKLEPRTGVLRHAVDWAVRKAHGVGRAPPDLKKAYRNPGWILTGDMTPVAVKALNDSFERTTARAMQVMGFRVQVNGTQNARANGHVGSGDGGVDVFARDVNGHLVVISCKRYSKPLGIEHIRQIHSMAHSESFRGAKPMVVTTIGYTKPATDFAEKNGIILATLDGLIEESTKYQV